LKIRKGYKFKLEPTEEQKIKINKTLGCCRFVYNSMLDRRLTFSPRLKRGDSCINHHCAATEAVASYTMSDRRYFPCVPRYGMY